ncbi:hypothetical protein [Nesterenkonia massiliensis]|uniref:hypothetical protein n=1 Tax=Nesterenkonia massiliensis TaxID=1232429 RepID=UPI00040F68EA|nr:hypothetical protein [Nesterenkonia massiliensis]
MASDSTAHDGAGSPPQQGNYLRPGRPFSPAELHSLCLDGVLQHVFADVYAAAELPADRILRTGAAACVLSSALQDATVLCGETAAWIHLGGQGPHVVTVISAGTFRRSTGPLRRWQVHQVPLSRDECAQHQGGLMPVTVPVRTAVDLLVGVGIPGDRRRLDELLTHAADASPISGPSLPAEHELRRRLELVAALVAATNCSAPELAETVCRRLSYTARVSMSPKTVQDLLETAL